MTSGRFENQRTQKRFVNESGEFAQPVSLSGTAYQSMLDDDQDVWQPSNSTEQTFLFDEEADWDQPLQQSAPQRRPVPPPRRKPSPPPSRGRRKHRGSWRTYGWVVLMVLSLSGVLVLGVMMMPQLAGYFWKDFPNFAFINGELLVYDAQTVAAYKQYRAYMDRDVIYPGVFVDGVHVGDMTIAEAEQALGAAGNGIPNAFSVTVAIGNKTWTVDPSNVPASRDLGNVLQKAYAYGRTNSTVIQTTMQTPFRERTNQAVALRTNGVNLTTTASYDHDAVRLLVQEIAAYVTREPINAEIQSFDYNTRTFSFTQSQPGVTLDQELLYQRLIVKVYQELKIKEAKND